MQCECVDGGFYVFMGKIIPEKVREEIAGGGCGSREQKPMTQEVPSDLTIFSVNPTS